MLLLLAERMKVKEFITKKPFVIAGPCSAETEEQTIEIAKAVEDVADVFRAGIWKPRTNPNSFEGVGLEGIDWLKSVKQETSLKVATEIANAKHVDICLSAGVDVLWIGARTTVNPFYVQEIAKALQGVDIPVLVKNPIHPELGLWLGAFERLMNAGVTQIGAVHRGFYSYEKSAFRNNPKWELPIRLREEFREIPIICDPSHIAGHTSLIKEISQTAMDLNFDGLMIETHLDPSIALSDADQQLTPKELSTIIKNLILREENLTNTIITQKLSEFRLKIDLFDKQIIKLLHDRNQIVKNIAEFKKENRITIFQLERWFEILRTRKKTGKNLDLDLQMIAELFELIHKYSIVTQTQIMHR